MEDGLRGDGALWAILTSLPNLRELAELACRREGLTDGDQGAGVAYFHEIEELARLDDMAEGDNIPAGYVQVFAGWGLPDGYEVVVPESEYLDTLATVLAWAGLGAEAERVRLLLRDGLASPLAAADPVRGGGSCNGRRPLGRAGPLGVVGGRRR